MQIRLRNQVVRRPRLARTPMTSAGGSKCSAPCKVVVVHPVARVEAGDQRLCLDQVVLAGALAAIVEVAIVVVETVEEVIAEVVIAVEAVTVADAAVVIN